MDRLRKITATLLVLFIIILFVTPVSAHRMLIEEISEGVVKVGYEDGRFSRRTVVVVYDQQGEEIARGALDGEGLFYYNPADAVLIEADDGLGHRTELVLGEEIADELPRGLTIALVSVGFLLIAGFFQYRIFKRKNNEEDLN